MIPGSVESIDDYAFYNCISLRSVTIGNGVKTIGASAFSFCSSLTSVTIPGSVESIGREIFEYCTSLKNVTIGNGVKSIGSAAFSGCSSLASITLPCVFERFGDIFGTISYTGGTSIQQSIMYYIPATLKSVTVTGGDIPDAAFYNCSMLTSITIRNGVKSIGISAFYNCNSLTSVVIPDSVTSIGDNAFRECKSLTSVYITDISNWCGISFGNYFANPLSNAKNLYLNSALVEELVIPDDVTSIGNYVFWNCVSLKSIVIPNGVESIGKYAFAYCKNLKSIKYRGTKTQWDAISKGSSWKPVSCTIIYNYTGA
jgi:hypothetical protein